MKNQQLPSAAIVCVIATGMPFGAGASTTEATDLMSPDSRVVVEHRLDRKGERIDARLDRKGDRADTRLDRKGDRINARLNRRGNHRQATRNARRGIGRQGARQSGYGKRGGDNRRVSGKRRR